MWIKFNNNFVDSVWSSFKVNVQSSALWMNRDSRTLTMKTTALFEDCWTWSHCSSFDISPVTFVRNSFSMLISMQFFTAISMEASCNGSQTSSSLLRSFIIANWPIRNISAAEILSINDNLSNVTTGPRGHGRDIILFNTWRGTRKVALKSRHPCIRGYQSTIEFKYMN